MKRIHSIELEDQEWWPRTIRESMTEFLQWFIDETNDHAPIVPLLREALERCQPRRVVDLCSGAGGPWIRLIEELNRDRSIPVRVCLTDLYPNREAFSRSASRTSGAVTGVEEPVDALNVPERLGNFVTLFQSFHHFSPPQARRILNNAVQRGHCIAVFDRTANRLWGVAMMLLVPLIVLFLTPWIRPFKWSRLFWTYVLPLLPFALAFDGIVSILRVYSPRELEQLILSVPGADRYDWQYGEQREGKSPIGITYLIGTPKMKDSQETEVSHLLY